MNNCSDERNSLMLKAWNEWKIVCSILGCSPENCKLLLQEVGNAFRKKILFICHERLPVLTDSDAEHDETIQEAENKIFAHEFDIALEVKTQIPGINKHTRKEKEKKFYKDIAWQAINQSSEPPLKIIRGMLLGGTGNYGAPLNMVVLEYLEKNYGYQYVTDFEKRRRINKPLSLETPVDGEDGGTSKLGDFITELCTPSELKPIDRDYLEKKIPSLFSKQEMAVLLAEVSDIALTNEELLQFIGLNKTAAYDKKNEAHNKLYHLLKENFDFDDIPNALACALTIVFLHLKTENPSSKFLCMVQEMNPEL